MFLKSKQKCKRVSNTGSGRREMRQRENEAEIDICGKERMINKEGNAIAQIQREAGDRH